MLQGTNDDNLDNLEYFGLGRLLEDNSEMPDVPEVSAQLLSNILLSQRQDASQRNDCRSTSYVYPSSAECCMSFI
jgi:hypothetical protein